MKKQIFIIIGIIVLIVVVVLISRPGKEGEGVVPEGEGAAPEADFIVETPEPAEPAVITREEVPEDIVVPEIGEAPESEKIAIPKTVAESAPDAKTKFRRFEIQAEKDAYLPSEIIVREGDIVHIDFAAIDKTYDITFPDYGMKQTARQGETKILEFQAVKPGKFLYYCEACGGIEGEVKGHIVIAPK